MHSSEGQWSLGQRFKVRDAYLFCACFLHPFTVSRRGFSPHTMLRHNRITSETPTLMGLQNVMYRTLHFPGDVSETNGKVLEKHSVTRRTTERISSISCYQYQFKLCTQSRAEVCFSILVPAFFFFACPKKKQRIVKMRLHPPRRIQSVPGMPP